LFFTASMNAEHIRRLKKKKAIICVAWTIKCVDFSVYIHCIDFKSSDNV